MMMMMMRKRSRDDDDDDDDDDCVDAGDGDDELHQVEYVVCAAASGDNMATALRWLPR